MTKVSFKKIFEDDNIQSMQYGGTHDVFELEQKLCNYYGKKHCLLFSNATTAIFTLTLALELRKKHIIVPPLGWGGAISPFFILENEISFSELDNTLCMDPDPLNTAFEKDTKAVMSIDYGGSAANSKEIKRVCENEGIFYISDSSQSFGAIRDGHPAGYWADAIVTSFTHGKTLYGGEGGAIVLDDTELYGKLIFLSQHPSRQKKMSGSSYNAFTPINGRINPLAAILINVLYDEYFQRIAIKQQHFYELVENLYASGIIEKLPWSNYNNSTYFNLVLPITNSNTSSLGPNNCTLSIVDEADILTNQILDSEYNNFLRRQYGTSVKEIVSNYQKVNTRVL